MPGAIRWDPEVYNRFEAQRRQPSYDLAVQFLGRGPKRILDVGCGTGLSTQVLCEFFPDAEILGLDSSEEMLKAAGKRLPAVEFIHRDAAELEELGEYDLIFANACLQWFPNQKLFLEAAYRHLRPGGSVAFQIPLLREMAACRCVEDAVSEFPGLASKAKPSYLRVRTLDWYYKVLRGFSDKGRIWKTVYEHELSDVPDILQFLRGTALRPYTDVLPEEKAILFLEKVLQNLAEAYPLMDNGHVLFAFVRLFGTVEKPDE